MCSEWRGRGQGAGRRRAVCAEGVWGGGGGRRADVYSYTPSLTPSIAFRHLPPNSARFGYATEGELFISEQLSSDAVSALRKVRVPISL